MASTRRLTAHLALALAASLATHATWASKPDTPTSLPGGKVISVEEGKQLLDTRSAVFVDTRSVVNFGKGRVPGAVTAAYKEKSEPVPDFDTTADSFELDKLPRDKNTRIVFYSDGPTGWKSYKAAVLSVKAGHKQVLYMRGGLSDWQAKALPLER